MGLLPWDGSISLDGNSLQHISPRQIAKQIGVLSQHAAIYFNYTVYDTVMMGRYLHIKGRFLNTPNEKDKAVVLKSLEAVGLAQEKDTDITKLSGGQVQRVFLARTLAQNPRVLLLDEPTNHLDLKYQIEIIEYIKKWAVENECIIVGVLHDINLALALSDHLVLMKDGEILANDSADRILSDGVLDGVYDMNVRDYMLKSFERWKI